MEATIIFTLSLSILLQLIAAGLVLRLIWVIGKVPAWVFISAAVVLMAVLRGITLFRLLTNDLANPPDLVAELVALVISTLMVAGIAGIAPLFRAFQRSDRALRESEEQFQRLVEAAPNGILVVNHEGHIVLVNTRTEQMFGYNRGELLGKPVETLVPERFQEAHVGHRRKYFSQPASRPLGTGLELTGQRKDGSEIPVDISLSPMETDEGVLFISIISDMTEQKQAEIALRKSEARLKEAQRIAHIGSWELDLVENILTWSGESYRMFEIDPQAFGVSYEAFLDTVHPDDRAMVDEAYTASVKNKTPYEIVHRLLFPDGRVKFVHERCETHYDAEGNPLRSIGTVQDITARHQAEEEIRQLNEELEQRVAERTQELSDANAELEAFSYSVSHDLRAPLRAIDGFSRILLDEYSAELSPEPQRYLDLVRNNTQIMGQLIDDLLGFSQLGRQPLTRQSVSPAAIVRLALADLEAEQEGRRVEISIGDPARPFTGSGQALPDCVADPALLKQVFANLVGNALKYTRSRKVARIEVGSREENGQVVYFVKDNGVGFDMRYADKLFGVFQRLHRVEEFEGTGVGLATVKRIIHRHGGRVWAEAEVDRGATFYFTLPVSGRQP